MRPTLALVTLAAAAAALAGCSSSGSPAPSPTGPPRCAELVGDPHWATTLKAAGGCLNAAGDSTIITGSFDCTDGSKLFQFDDGPHHYWGFSTGPLHRSTTPSATDPGYGAAYRKCHR